MASNEFRKCKKLIKRAKTCDDIVKAVDKLDAVWFESGMSLKIMKDKDWLRLTNVVSKAAHKLGIWVNNYGM